MMTDRFVQERLPPAELWPEFDFSALPELAYPPRFNCATELLDRMVAGGRAERPVLYFGDARWTYRMLADKVDRIARVLVDDLGLQSGNRVLLRGFNNPMMVACWFAIAKAGGVVVATMPLLRAAELGDIVDKAAIGLCLCQDSLDGEVEAVMRQTPHLARLCRFSALGDGTAELDRALDGKPAQFTAFDSAGDDPVLVAFTSGTTGRAKGTIHFHRDILAICDTFPRHVAGLRADDIFVGTPPIAFTFGLGAQVLFPMRVGAATVLIESFGRTTLLEAITRYRVTGLYTAPTGYRNLAPLAKDYDLSSLRLCISAGEHLPQATWELWRRTTGIGIIDGIGSTELLHIFVSAAGADIRPGATGKAVPGYRATILDDAGHELPPGAEGWLAIKGPTGCRYLDDPERQKGYVRHGWNITGDIYRRDQDGYFWYVARGDDMIISAGYNISGPEVENVLLTHPKVAECAVIGVPDAERGQMVAAYVVPKPEVEASDGLIAELQDYVKRSIAPYKYPRQVLFRDALPRTPTGKLQRFRLREES